MLTWFVNLAPQLLLRRFPLDCRSLSVAVKRALHPASHLVTIRNTRSFAFSRLHTLFNSKISVSPLFYGACTLFAKNTRGGGVSGEKTLRFPPKTQTEFKCRTKS